MERNGNYFFKVFCDKKESVGYLFRGLVKIIIFCLKNDSWFFFVLFIYEFECSKIERK